MAFEWCFSAFAVDFYHPTSILVEHLDNKDLDARRGRGISGVVPNRFGVGRDRTRLPVTQKGIKPGFQFGLGDSVDAN